MYFRHLAVGCSLNSAKKLSPLLWVCSHDLSGMGNVHKSKKLGNMLFVLKDLKVAGLVACPPSE